MHCAAADVGPRHVIPPHSAAALIQRILRRRGNFFFSSLQIYFWRLPQRKPRARSCQSACFWTDRYPPPLQTSVTCLKCKESAGLIHVREKKKKTKKEEENLGRNLRQFTRKKNELTGARFRFVTLMMSLADTSAYESVLVLHCGSLASAERQQFFFSGFKLWNKEAFFFLVLRLKNMLNPLVWLQI